MNLFYKRNCCNRKKTPTEGFTIWDLPGADLPENTYDLIHDVRGSFETE